MTDGRRGERWGWFGFHVSGFRFQVSGFTFQVSSYFLPLTQRDKVGGGAFWFQVSSYFLPLRQGEYPQGEGV